MSDINIGNADNALVPVGGVKVNGVTAPVYTPAS